MKLNPRNSFLLGYQFVMFIFWLGIQMSSITDLKINLMWGMAINFIPLFGGLFGLYTAGQWGGIRSSVGKGIIFLSFGNLSWSAGNFIWSYYNFFLSSDIPYPSLADLGYVGALPLWIAGILLLSKATGVRFGLRKIKGRIMLVLLPIIAAIFSYYFLFVVARESSIDWQEGMLKLFFDLAYPIGDWIILTVAFLVWGLSLNYLGGRYKWPVLITLFGFVLMFCADFSFSYTTTIETYFNGSLSDLLFTMALFTIGFGISSLDSN